MRIVATADVPTIAREAFAALGDIVVDRACDGQALAEAEILIVRGTRLDAKQLARADRLRAIARTGAGYDNLDVAAATARGVPIVYAPGMGSRPVAEGTLALILAAAKRLRELGGVMHEAGWASRYQFVGLDIDGACLGVVGLGAIGRRVAGLCSALGMEVIAYDPAAGATNPTGIELVPLAGLVARADVITLHCALTDATRGLVDRALLSRVKPGAILVNVARGEIVESEDALADALVSGRLSAVALDVFPTEPPEARHRLYADPRVICTPHAVGLTRRWNEEVFGSLARGVQSVLAGELPANVLNPQALTGSRRGAAYSSGMTEKLDKTEQEWREELSHERFHVLREKGTEPPFTGAYTHSKTDGMYRCGACGAELFSSDAKFDSGTGWPSFTEPAVADAVELHPDRSHGMTRTEVTCARCGGHLGHVFPDGPGANGQRYCINSLSLDLDEDAGGS